ncbi:MAG: sel1 repeat family protein [Proteobacteria bacterium]|jgi:hypothetical protein|nr:sel1 repeat family protein [Pseudomonadota bacterium]
MLAGMLPGIFLFMVSTACLANGVDARLNRDKTVTGAVTGTATDKYTFTVEAGKSFVLSLDKSEKQFDKDFMLAVKLFDPDKRLLAGGAQQLFFRAPFINEAEGDWTIEIGRGDRGASGGAYEIKFMEVPGSSGVPMKFHKTYKGNILRGGIDVYTIKGAPDLMGDLSLAPEGGQGFIPEVTVISPRGELMNSAGCTESCELGLPLMEPGTYTILVWRIDQQDVDGSYSLAARKTGDGMVDDPAYNEDRIVERMENEKTVSGVVRVGDIHRYGFSVASGSSFVISLSEIGEHGPGANIDVKLFDPDNRLVEGRSFELNTGFQVVEASAGDWRIDVGLDIGHGEKDGNEQGRKYEMTLFQVPGAQGKRMKFGETYSGDLFRGKTGVYTISGTPDVLGRIRFTPKEEVSVFPEITVFSPNGGLATAIGCSEGCFVDLDMKEYGDYTVIVSQIEANDQKSGYELTVKRTDGEPEISDIDIKRAFLNPVAPVFPDNLMKMARSASVYRGGMFLPLTSRELKQEDREAAEAGDAIAQLHVGDCSYGAGAKFAIEWWEKAAAQGNVTARNRLGAVPLQGKESKNRQYQTAGWYSRIIEQGKADRAFEHANRMMGGCTKAQDFALNRKLLREQAEKGVAVAQYNLAVLYAFGFDEPENFAEAAKWYSKAADQGFIVAMNNLGELYEHGDGVTQSDAKALKLYRRAAEEGYPQAIYNLGRFAAAGRGMPKNQEKAAEWFQQAADEGHVNAQAELYLLQSRTDMALKLWYRTARIGNKQSLRRLIETYREIGVPVPRYQSGMRKFFGKYLLNDAPVLDYDDVLELYRTVAKEIDPRVFSGLADLFAKQNPPDYFEAYYWYSLVLDSLEDAYLPADEKKTLGVYAESEAAQMAKKLSPEQIVVAKWRIDDRHPASPSEELKEAARIFLRAKRAYEEDDHSSSYFYLKSASMGLPRAQMQVGANLDAGNDFERAIGFYKKALLGGRIEAASWMGKYYHFGIAVPQDLNKAAEWYELDASRGFKPAIDRLGWIYLNGLQNSGEKAVAMYEKAVARGIYEANNALGMIYLYGLGGVSKDHKKALKWYLKSAERGHPVGAIQAAAILTNYLPYDYDRALKLLSRAGSPVALNNRAYMYEHGLDAKDEAYLEGQPKPTALELYQTASDMCYGHAMFNIGRLYARGVNAPQVSAVPIKKDLMTARIWMEKAAMQGSVAANMWLDANPVDTAAPEAEMGKMFKTAPITEIGYLPKACEEKKRGQQ